MSFPEVDRVLGKAGRAETSTDPAPFSMMETIVELKPEIAVAQSAHLVRPGRRWTKPLLRRITPDHISTEAAGRRDEPGAAHSRRLQRLDHAHQGPHRHADHRRAHARGHQDLRPGPQADRADRHGRSKRVLPQVPGTRSVFAERAGGGYFLDFDLKRDQLARYGLSVDDAQAVVMNAIGGDNVTTAIEGRERYPINVRYFRDSRSVHRAPGPRAGPRHGRQDADPAGRNRHSQADHRPFHAAQRKRHAERLRVRRRGGPRHRRLRGGGQARGARPGEAAAGLHARLERPVRGHGARAGAAEGRPAADAVPDLPAAVPQHPVGRQDRAHPAGRAVLGGGRHLAALRCWATT